MLAAILTPTWLVGGHQFLDSLMTWEDAVTKYELAAGVQLPTSVKCAILMRWSPRAIRDYLLNPKSVGNTFHISAD